MDRLTQRDEYGNADIIALSDMMPEIYAGLSFSETNALTDVLNRLAAYEDTGLEPEEIIGRLAKQKVEDIFTAETKKALDKLMEYKTAEKEGRLLVLPCKVGDTVCCLNPFDEIENGKITMIQQKADGTWKFRVTTSFSHDVTIDAIGKTVFLTREAAEAALKEREGK